MEILPNQKTSLKDIISQFSDEDLQKAIRFHQLHLNLLLVEAEERIHNGRAVSEVVSSAG